MTLKTILTLLLTIALTGAVMYNVQEKVVDSYFHYLITATVFVVVYAILDKGIEYLD